MSVVIVGAGISGLSLAYLLRQRGEKVRVLEASDRAGGTIHTTTREGFLTESGPNGFLDKEPATRALVASLGLNARLREAAPTVKRRFIFTRRALREVPAKPPAFLKSDVVPLSTKLRMAGELFSGRSRAEDESLSSFARRHIGKHASSILVDAMQSGIFAGDPDRLSLKATFPRMAELEREHRSLVLGMIRLQKQRKGAPVDVGGPSGALCSFEGGLSTLVETLANALGDSLALNARVSSISPTQEGWSLRVDGREERATSLVLATPAHVSAQLLAPASAELGRELSEIEYAKIAAVHVGFPASAFAQRPEGFGFLIPHAEGRNLLGVIYVSSIFPWRAPADQFLFTCMAGGARHPELVDLGDASLIKLVRDELELALGVKAEPSFVAINRWQRGIPQYNVGHLARVERIRALTSKLPSLHLTGNAFDGVGLNDCVRASQHLAEALAPRA